MFSRKSYTQTQTQNSYAGGFLSYMLHHFSPMLGDFLSYAAPFSPILAGLSHVYACRFWPTLHISHIGLMLAETVDKFLFSSRIYLAEQRHS